MSVRPGMYDVPGDDGADDGRAEDGGAEDDHRRLIAATYPTLLTASVLSYESAALLHHLPVDRRRLGTIHVSRRVAGDGETAVSGSKHARLLTVHRERHLESTEAGGYRVTSLALTAVDLARRGPFRDAVAVVDAALRAGAERSELEAIVRRQRRPGNPVARRAIEVADPRSESPGESHSRAVMLVSGVTMPRLQHVVRDSHGVMRLDFAWLEQRVAGEFDGRVKYGRLLGPGQRAQDVVRAEKLREARLRRLGWTVIRWTWDDLADRHLLADLIRATLHGRALVP